MTYWQAFYDVEHIGGPNDRADLRMGILAANAWNIAAAQAGQTPEFEATSFLPKFEEPRGEVDSAVNVSPEEFSAFLHARFPLA